MMNRKENCKKISKTVRHHYISEFYLKKFTNERGKIWVYDKQEDVLQERSTKDTTLEKHLYTIEGENYDYIEQFFKRNEDLTGRILSDIINKREITIKDKVTFSHFIALCIFRTPFAISENDKFISKILTDCKNTIVQNGNLEPLAKQMNISIEDIKNLTTNVEVCTNKAVNLEMLINYAEKYAECFSKMEWYIYYIEDGNFLTSDRPLSLLSKVNYGFLVPGILMPGVKKIFPISSKVLLVMGDYGKNVIQGLMLKDKRVIRHVNISTFVNAKRFVLSNNKGLIEDIHRRVRNKGFV